ncbi:MAG TPA: mechanosensitive ion channel domain-containing protein [Gemmatimonadaceae bacterium]
MLHDFLEIELFTLGGVPMTVGTLLTALLIIAIAWVGSRVLQRSVRRALERRGWAQDGSISVGQRLAHYLVMLVATGIALDTAGIELATLFAAGAIFAVGLGFAMQNIAQNFVSGIILLIERSIKPGDILEVGGAVVKVERLGIRSTLARSRDEEQLIIPNSMLVQSTVKNFTLHDSLFRVRATVGVSYASDLEVVQDVLTRAARAVPWRQTAPDPRILLLGFGNSSVDYEVSVWVDDPWEARTLLSALNQAIWWGLKEAGVTIAFPQMDVHFDPTLNRVLQSWGGRAA